MSGVLLYMVVGTGNWSRDPCIFVFVIMLDVEVLLDGK